MPILPADVLYLTESDVESLVSAEDAVAVIRELFQQLGQGQASAMPRQRVRAGSVMLHGMLGAANYLNVVAWKMYITSAKGAQFLVGLYHADETKLVALMEGDRLGQLRTGATSAVAAETLLDKSGPVRLAIIGTGWQAEAQLDCISQVIPITEVRVFSRSRERREAFVNRYRDRHFKMLAAESSATATDGAEVVVTMTTSSKPVVESAALHQCRLLIAAGSNSRTRCEIPVELVGRAVQVVCDHRDGCQNEAGELIAAADQGIWKWEQAVELSQVIQSAQPAPSLGLTIFKSIGMACEDAAMAHYIYQRWLARTL